jgi:hypothetical protein
MADQEFMADLLTMPASHTYPQHQELAVQASELAVEMAQISDTANDPKAVGYYAARFALAAQGEQYNQAKFPINLVRAVRALGTIRAKTLSVSARLSTGETHTNELGVEDAA